jgi:Ca2+:H+ antiporter
VRSRPLCYLIFSRPHERPGFWICITGVTTANRKGRGVEHASESLTVALRHNRLNLLLLLVPASWALALIRPESPWLFVVAAVSILPLAAAIGDATNALAHSTGPTLGGFLNATFGNAAELIIGIVALHAHRADLVKASISGAIIGNLLAVLGLSMFVGGLRRETQHFNRRSAGNATIMLFLAVVALIMPAVFDLTVFGSLQARPAALFKLGLWTSVLLVVAYAGGLVYTFTMQRDLFHSEAPETGAFSKREAVALLGVASAGIAVQAELLVAGLDPMFAAFDVTELFSGVIVVALVGGAAESYSAVRAAYHDRMTLATEIAIGSSAQIALFVAPVLVFASFVLGDPMTLLFEPLEIAGIALSVVATAIVALDGESNWVEGLQLLAVYVVLGIAFFLVPPHT